MISEKKFNNYEEVLYIEGFETIKKEKIVENIYEIVKQKNIYDLFPTYDLQDEKLTQDILEVYKILFWGVSAVASALLWLYFFIT